MNQHPEGVSIITCTNKPIQIRNIFENYESQVWPEKELIIILNNDSMDIQQWRKRADHHPNVFIYQLPEHLSLGECLNYATQQTRYGYIANFDDDDYYAPPYLNSMMSAFEWTDADIIGKKTHYVYFESMKALYLRFPNKENQYVKWVCGGKKIVRRRVFEHVKYRNLSNSEDIMFCEDCRKIGFKIYSTDRHHLIYVRKKNPLLHTWKIKDRLLARSKDCTFVAHTDNYKTFFL